MEKVYQHVEKSLGLSDKEEDWLRLSLAQLRELEVDGFFRRHGGVAETRKLYPRKMKLV